MNYNIEGEVARDFCQKVPSKYCILQYERKKTECICMFSTLVTIFCFCLVTLVCCALEICIAIDSVMATEGCTVLDGSSFLSCTFYCLCIT